MSKLSAKWKAQWAAAATPSGTVVHIKVMAAARDEGRAQVAGLRQVTKAPEPGRQSQVAGARSLEPSRRRQIDSAKSPEPSHRSQVARASSPEPGRSQRQRRSGRTRATPLKDSGEAKAWSTCVEAGEMRVVQVSAVRASPIRIPSLDHFGLRRHLADESVAPRRRSLSAKAKLSPRPIVEIEPVEIEPVWIRPRRRR